MKKPDLKWYVMIHDFNADKIVKYNVLEYDYLIDSLKKAIKKKEITKYDELKEFVKRILMAQFWSRTEYEILVSGLHTRVEPQKIDVWYQIEMNLDNLLWYLIEKLKLDIKIKQVWFGNGRFKSWKLYRYIR